MNRALRISLGIPTSGLAKEEAKTHMIVLEILKKTINKEKQKNIKD